MHNGGGGGGGEKNWFEYAGYLLLVKYEEDSDIPSNYAYRDINTRFSSTQQLLLCLFFTNKFSSELLFYGVQAAFFERAP